MSRGLVIARPYAKALFEHALEAKALAQWSGWLFILSNVVSDEVAAAFFENPESTPFQQKELLMAPFATDFNTTPTLTRFVDLIVEQGRVWVLPVLFEQFQALCAEHEKTVKVLVRSFSALSDAQEQALMARLSERLQRQVCLEVSIDASLLGGAVIHAGDLVIDGSVRGKLDMLYTDLVA